MAAPTAVAPPARPAIWILVFLFMAMSHLLAFHTTPIVAERRPPPQVGRDAPQGGRSPGPGPAVRSERTPWMSTPRSRSRSTISEARPRPAERRTPDPELLDGPRPAHPNRCRRPLCGPLRWSVRR